MWVCARSEALLNARLNQKEQTHSVMSDTNNNNNQNTQSNLSSSFLFIIFIGAAYGSPSRSRFPARHLNEWNVRRRCCVRQNEDDGMIYPEGLSACNACYTIFGPLPDWPVTVCASHTHRHHTYATHTVPRYFFVFFLAFQWKQQTERMCWAAWAVSSQL